MIKLQQFEDGDVICRDCGARVGYDAKTYDIPCPKKNKDGSCGYITEN